MFLIFILQLRQRRVLIEAKKRGVEVIHENRKFSKYQIHFMVRIFCFKVKGLISKL